MQVFDKMPPVVRDERVPAMAASPWKPHIAASSTMVLIGGGSGGEKNRQKLWRSQMGPNCYRIVTSLTGSGHDTLLLDLCRLFPPGESERPVDWSIKFAERHWLEVLANKMFHSVSVYSSGRFPFRFVWSFRLHQRVENTCICIIFIPALLSTAARIRFETHA